MKISNYAIHDILNFQIKKLAGPVKKYLDTTSIQFQNFISDNNSPSDFTVEIGPFSRENRVCSIIDDNYYVADDYIYFKDRRKLSKWEVEISGIERLPRVRITTNFVGNITAPLNIVEFFIQYCLLKKGISVIHASGVGKRGKCVVFPARSGGGKTIVALSSLDRGFSYLGDNFIILDKGVARSYINPLNIFTYNRLQVVEKNLTPKQKLSLFLKRNLCAITGGYFKIFEKINPINIFNDLIVDNCPIYLICLLEVNNVSTKNKLVLKSIPKDILVKKLRYNMELDLIAFSKCIYSYGYVLPNSVFSRFWELYEHVLEHNLPSGISTVSIEVPLQLTESVIDEIVDLVEDNLFV